MALVLFDASICANDHIICGWLLILLMGTGDPLMPANPLGMGLDQILDPSRVVGLFAGMGLGWQNPAGLNPFHPTRGLDRSGRYVLDRGRHRRNGTSIMALFDTLT
jgi:hypothetical protein